MSFLEELKKKKQTLSHTKTQIKSTDGRVFLEDVQSGSKEFKFSTYAFVVDTKPDLTVAKVLPGLFIGSQDIPHSLQHLLQHNITHILSLGVEVPNYPGFIYSYIEALDLPEFSLTDIFPMCFKIIDSARKTSKNVLVHCNAGVSRSASVVIGYLMQECDMNYTCALNFLKNLRPSVKPNEGFEKQLLRFEESLKKKCEA